MIQDKLNWSTLSRVRTEHFYPLSVYRYIHPFIFLSKCTYISIISNYLSIYLFIYATLLSIFISIYIYLFIHPIYLSVGIPYTFMRPQYIYGPKSSKRYLDYFIGRIHRDYPVPLPMSSDQLVCK